MSSLRRAISAPVIISLISGLCCGHLVTDNGCREQCTYERRECMEGCDQHSAHISFEWKQTDSGYTGVWYSCIERCEQRYRRCLQSCDKLKNE